MEVLLSPREEQAEISFSIDPTPVICTSLQTTTPDRVPAVRANHPTFGHVLFPLNRLELGDVWYGQAQTSSWHARPLDGGWDRAFTTFRTLVRYPPQFLRPLLDSLRTQTFLDSTPLRWTQWSYVCKNTTPRLYATSDCHLCGKSRSLSMRLLNDVGRTLHDFQCAHVGATCGDDTDRIHNEYFDVPPPAQTLAPLLTPVPYPLLNPPSFSPVPLAIPSPLPPSPGSMSSPLLLQPSPHLGSPVSRCVPISTTTHPLPRNHTPGRT